ncbi:MAG: hypothetical protein IPH38_01145 [Candidatus Microthrix sp.]|nr:MATE family efflux transporter [Candidatus Microthrix sp.]MBK7018223.1 hypothetical protein [Candidatus Microthrix sp.]
MALRSIFLMAVFVAGQMGTVELAAYQIGIGVWTFLAFAYDGIETAGQALVARELGGRRHALAQSAAALCCSGRSRCRLRWGWRPCWGTRWSQACSAAILSW